jgi:5-methylcytosine-specific restriction endonuclease McrA
MKLRKGRKQMPVPTEHSAGYQHMYRKRNPIQHSLQQLKTKEYQQTLYGKFALKAGSVNTAAKNRGALDKITKNDLLHIFEKQRGKENNNTLIKEPYCAICWKPLQIFTPRGFIIDHKRAIGLGGKNKMGNIQLLCDPCHYKKTGNERKLIAKQTNIVKGRRDFNECLQYLPRIIKFIKQFSHTGTPNIYLKINDFKTIVPDIDIIYELLLTSALKGHRTRVRGLYCFSRNQTENNP